jgi:hypothetical protein
VDFIFFRARFLPTTLRGSLDSASECTKDCGRFLPIIFFGVSFAQESDEFSNPIFRPSFDESLLSPPLPLRSSRGASSRGLTITQRKIDCGSSGALSPQDLNLFTFNSRIFNSRILIYSPDSFIICCGFGSRDLEPWWIWFLHAAALPVLVCTGAALSFLACLLVVVLFL